MVWQDTVVTITAFSFGLMLLPAIKDSLNDKHVNKITAGLSTLGLFVLSFTFYTLGLTLSSIAQAFVGVMWLILFVLSMKNKK